MPTHGRARRVHTMDDDTAVPMVLEKVDGRLVLVRQDQLTGSSSALTGVTTALVVAALGATAAASGTGSDPAEAANLASETVPAATAPATVSAPAAAPAPAEAALVTVTADYELMAASKSTAKTVIDNALSQVGAPYVWGAKGKKTKSGKRAFDCSGFVWWAHQGTDKAYDYGNTQVRKNKGTPVAKGDLQPGDIVFFYRNATHMGIYTGNGMVVHASGNKEEGGQIKHVPLKKMKFHSARRL